MGLFDLFRGKPVTPGQCEEAAVAIRLFASSAARELNREEHQGIPFMAALTDLIAYLSASTMGMVAARENPRSDKDRLAIFTKVRQGFICRKTSGPKDDSDILREG